jgi:sialate O-acetylesterase
VSELKHAWTDNPSINLYNREGLPAVPIRTDRWPLEGKVEE